MANNALFSACLAELERSDLNGFALRSEAMRLLDGIPGYDWSGIYRLEGDVLVLDAFVGAPTEHTRIPVGVGVCGTAVASGESQIIGDVRELENYLSCSLSTRSEIVVLIHDEQGAVLGQIDIDSHEVNRFDGTDEAFLARIAEILASRWS